MRKIMITKAKDTPASKRAEAFIAYFIRFNNTLQKDIKMNQY